MRNSPARERMGKGIGSRESSSGFTLLEILVATAILGTAVAGLFGLLSGALGNMQRLRPPAQALMLGESFMNELLVAGLQSGGTAGAIPLDRKIQGRWNEQYRWEALASRFNTLPDTLPGQTILVRIALDVFWETAPGKPEKKLSLETYQLQQEPQRTNQ